MASLSEHAKAIEAAMEAARQDGYVIEATTCCCGEGLYIMDKTKDVTSPEASYWFSV